jgi:Na+-transporting NADH:ubiquinone oxidoreductase subunit C
MKLNTNSNIYTITYATIVVVIVAVLLALVNQSLKPKQDANIKLDQQKQMLVALNFNLDSVADPAAQYEELVRDTILMNEDSTKANIIHFEVNGEPKYILRLHGAGLWGGIGGYLALNEDKNTIYGINFNHESETPGLGALIVEKPFREQFKNKQIRNEEGEVVSVLVLKKGNKAENGEAQVDAVSGATITSTGVSDMLKANLEEYKEFLSEPSDVSCQPSEEIVKPIKEEE